VNEFSYITCGSTNITNIYYIALLKVIEGVGNSLPVSVLSVVKSYKLIKLPYKLFVYQVKNYLNYQKSININKHMKAFLRVALLSLEDVSSLKILRKPHCSKAYVNLLIPNFPFKLKSCNRESDIFAINKAVIAINIIL
jgi:hypothetical protein